ncbi:hypothetical protein NDU88_001706 [Pleurodeles waltl]|uniref:Uncharacterized protein n=1 Tax=Pleurodeles waltl TaxID=8319 RepID=A0AAV7U760_PLEWA|nr:hypothetical protein NDU88_001706 [Pleurodeles waltl]
MGVWLTTQDGGRLRSEQRLESSPDGTGNRAAEAAILWSSPRHTGLVAARAAVIAVDSSEDLYIGLCHDSRRRVKPKMRP